jgi:hypothetical protein
LSLLLALMTDGLVSTWIPFENCRTSIRMGMAKSSSFTTDSAPRKIAFKEENGGEKTIYEATAKSASTSRDTTRNVGVGRVEKMAVESINFR